MRKFQSLSAMLGVAAMLASGSAASAFDRLEPKPADQYLGPAVLGSNYKVKPQARTDGIMRIFDVETSFGQFEFSGVDFAKMRLRELDAVATLDKMSQSDSFMKSLGQSVVAPVQFGASLITNPVDTLNRSMSGVANMLDRANSGLAASSADRDSILDSLLGVSDTQRQLAVELGVDPYSDFPPLADRLKKMAGAMAGGKLPVKVGLSFVPGGAGIAASSVSTIEGARDTLRDKTAAQVITEVRGTLQSLNVSEEAINKLLGNRNFTPADLLLMARSLARIKADSSEAYVTHAAASASRVEAYYQRRRSELLGMRRNELGGIEVFFATRGQVLTLTRNDTVVAGFPFDDFAWTEATERAFRSATDDLRKGDTAKSPRVFATSGTVTPLATDSLQKLGWKVVTVKPTR